MLKTIYIAGVPASGKSSIMREVRNMIMPTPEPFKSGTLRGVRDGNVWAYGVFDGSMFEGTDKLSMCVIDDAIKHVEELTRDDGFHVLLVEGDRLFCKRFLKAAKAIVIVIDASEDVLMFRHKERKNCQTATRLKACRTKIENFCSKYGIARVFNNNLHDRQRIVREIVQIATPFVNK